MFLSFSALSMQQIVDGLGDMLQARRSHVRVPMSLLNFFNLLNHSSRIMPLGFSQPPTEMSARKYLWVQNAAGA
jgi:hypothetical protein